MSGKSPSAGWSFRYQSACLMNEQMLQIKGGTERSCWDLFIYSGICISIYTAVLMLYFFIILLFFLKLHLVPLQLGISSGVSNFELCRQAAWEWVALFVMEFLVSDTQILKVQKGKPKQWTNQKGRDRNQSWGKSKLNQINRITGCRKCSVRWTILQKSGAGDFHESESINSISSEVDLGIKSRSGEELWLLSSQQCGYGCSLSTTVMEVLLSA